MPQTRPSNGLKYFGPETPRRRGENGKTVKELDREAKARKQAEKEQKVRDLEALEEEEAEHAASAAQTPVNARKNLPRQAKTKMKTKAPPPTKQGPKSTRDKAVVGTKTTDMAANDHMVVDVPMDSSARAAPQGRKGSRSNKGKGVAENPSAPKPVDEPENAMNIDNQHVPPKKRQRVVQIITEADPEIRSPVRKRQRSQTFAAEAEQGGESGNDNPDLVAYTLFGNEIQPAVADDAEAGEEEEEDHQDMGGDDDAAEGDGDGEYIREDNHEVEPEFGAEAEAEIEVEPEEAHDDGDRMCIEDYETHGNEDAGEFEDHEDYEDAMKGVQSEARGSGGEYIPEDEELEECMDGEREGEEEGDELNKEGDMYFDQQKESEPEEEVRTKARRTAGKATRQPQGVSWGEGGHQSVPSHHDEVATSKNMAKKAPKPTAKKPQKQPQSKPAPTNHESQVHSPAKRSALTKARIVAPKKPAQRNEDDEESQAYTGIFDDRDEYKDFEGDHARNSPTKNGRRADSKALVEVKRVSKPRKRVKNTDLPAQLMDDGTWQEVILPALMLWAGFQHDPWVSKDKPLRDALLVIGRHVVGPSYELTIEGKTTLEIARASQRLCDGWRTFFGSTALHALHIFFEEKGLDTYDDRVKWAAAAMKSHGYLYRKVKESKEGTVSTFKRFGFLQNELIYRTFAVHLSTMKDAEWIPGLSRDFPGQLPRGALALAATAVERAVKLWGTGKVLNTDANVQGIGAIQFLPQPGSRGRTSTRYTAFSHAHWGATTQSMLALMEKILPDDKMEYVMECSHDFVSRSAAGDQKPSNLPVLDPLLCLVDNDVDGDSSDNEELGQGDHRDPIDAPIIPRPKVPHTSSSGTSRPPPSSALRASSSGASRALPATGSRASSLGASRASSASSSRASSVARPQQLSVLPTPTPQTRPTPTSHPKPATTLPAQPAKQGKVTNGAKLKAKSQSNSQRV